MFFKCDEMSQSTALTVKTILVFLEYVFQFFINKALPRIGYGLLSGPQKCARDNPER